MAPGDAGARFGGTPLYMSPEQKRTMTALREGKTVAAPVTLLNRNGDTNLIRRKIYTDAQLGANFEAVEYGVKIFKLKEEGLLSKIGLPENYTIVAINRQRVKDPEEVIEFFSKYKGRVLLQGLTSSKEQLPLEFVLR